MGFTLDKVVPWGRSYDEYVAMFGLHDDDLKRRILGCGDGPAAFNAELTRRGGKIVSVDPIYSFDSSQIRRRIHETYEAVMAQTYENRGNFVWTTISSVEELGRVRMAAMEDFLSDYDRGKSEGRYIAGELPTLPFEDGSFDVALSSHLLFLYSNHLSADLHIQAIKEMLRVAGEVRVFPLLTLEGEKSPHVGGVTTALDKHGFTVTVRLVPYEFQRGGNEMLVVRHAASRMRRPRGGRRR